MKQEVHVVAVVTHVQQAARSQGKQIVPDRYSPSKQLMQVLAELDGQFAQFASQCLKNPIANILKST